MTKEGLIQGEEGTYVWENASVIQKSGVNFSVEGKNYNLQPPLIDLIWQGSPLKPWEYL